MPDVTPSLFIQWSNVWYSIGEANRNESVWSETSLQMQHRIFELQTEIPSMKCLHLSILFIFTHTTAFTSKNFALLAIFSFILISKFSVWIIIKIFISHWPQLQAHIESHCNCRWHFFYVFQSWLKKKHVNKTVLFLFPIGKLRREISSVFILF